MRAGLSKRQLLRYEEICQNLKEPFRTILLLLHLTGFRINEMCTLKTDQINQVGDRYMIDLIGKGGKPRTIPLSSKAQRLLMSYLKIYQPTLWFLREERTISSLQVYEIGH